MKGPFTLWALALVLATPAPASFAQSSDADTYRKDIERARTIVQRIWQGEQPNPGELSLLDDVLQRAAREADANKKPGRATASTAPERTPAPDKPAPDKREARPQQREIGPNLFAYTIPRGKVYMYVVDLQSSYLRGFWQDRHGQPYQNIARLREDARRDRHTLKFAINGGIFDERARPQGLYVEEGKILSQLDTGTGRGNFYMEPNGVFMVDFNKTARLLTTQQFREQFQGKTPATIRLAVQSGPMLLRRGQINKDFGEDSLNKTRRTGVGILDEHRVVFGMSSSEINFRDFASLFADMGCTDALYFDGGPIPAMYVEDQLEEAVDGDLVTILGVSDKEVR